VHYVEGCSAPVYSTDSLHSAVVELVALPGSRITYTTIQNWSNNVYNLVTRGPGPRPRRAWSGSRKHRITLTMKYPSVYLMAPRRRARFCRWPMPGQVSTGRGGPRWSMPLRRRRRPSVEVDLQGRRPVDVPGPRSCQRRGQARQELRAVRCLILDEQSTSETKPYMEVEERDAQIGPLRPPFPRWRDQLST